MIRFTHPCNVDGCTITLEGEIDTPESRGTVVTIRANHADAVKPTLPVTWSPESAAHIEAHK